MKVYLAGPIGGCTTGEASNWRTKIKTMLDPSNCIDPFRRDYRGSEHSASEIVILDKRDILASDYVVANCWKKSPGTSMEILFAWEHDIPVIVIVPYEHVSPWIVYHSIAIVHTIEEAVDEIASTI